jgi:hypothetical protein
MWIRVPNRRCLDSLSIQLQPFTCRCLPLHTTLETIVDFPGTGEHSSPRLESLAVTRTDEQIDSLDLSSNTTERRSTPDPIDTIYLHVRVHFTARSHPIPALLLRSRLRPTSVQLIVSCLLPLSLPPSPSRLSTCSTPPSCVAPSPSLLPARSVRTLSLASPSSTLRPTP